jgi:hypothetical protein
MAALWLWRQFPRQIASDLSQYHHRRIAEWHPGYVLQNSSNCWSSCPEKGVQDGCAGGEYSEEDQVWRHIANRLSRLESITYVAHGGKAGEPIRMFYTLAEVKEMAADAEAVEDRREDFFAFADRDPMFELEEADI